MKIRDAGTTAIFNGDDTQAARKCCPENLWRTARRKLSMLNVAGALLDLALPPGNHLEALKRDRAGQHSSRVNDKYRICFRWTDSGAIDVELVDYH